MKYITQCCVCGSIRKNKKWIDIGYKNLTWLTKLFPDVAISHGYCPECYREAMDFDTHLQHHGYERHDYIAPKLIRDLGIEL